MKQHEQLPTGKSIIRQFDADGRVRKETHMYGMLDIGIELEFDSGVKTSELYFVKKRLVSRQRYDQACNEYVDMPSPDINLEDLSGELIKGAQAERRQFAKAAKEHKPDAGLAAEIDSFCTEMLKAGRRADASNWLTSAKHNLGELSHAKSRTLIAKLLRLGAKCLVACNIDQYDVGEENSGDLVIELPQDPMQRKALLQEVARLAAEQGYRGSFDNGEKYAYIKLD